MTVLGWGRLARSVKWHCWQTVPAEGRVSSACLRVQNVLPVDVYGNSNGELRRRYRDIPSGAWRCRGCLVQPDVRRYEEGLA